MTIQLPRALQLHNLLNKEQLYILEADYYQAHHRVLKLANPNYYYIHRQLLHNYYVAHRKKRGQTSILDR